MIDLQKVLQLIPVNVYWQNREGVYQGCNEMMLRVIGLTESSQVVGHTILEIPIIDPGYAQAIYEYDQKLMAEGTFGETEDVAFDEFNSPAIYLTRKIPLKNDAGEVEGLVGISMNITDLKNSQDQLR